MNKQPPKKIPRFNRIDCMACIMCIDICPSGALDIKIQNSTNGFRRYPFLIDTDTCIGCGLCRQECPAGAIQMAARTGVAEKVR